MDPQENHTIKVQLSQLMELVWHLLTQTVQVAPQPADVSNLSPVLPPAESQSLDISGATLGLPPPSWSHPMDTALGDSPSSH